MSDENTQTLPDFDLALWDGLKNGLLDLEDDYLRAAKGVNSASVSLRKGLRAVSKALRTVNKASLSHAKKCREEKKAARAAKKAAAEASAALDEKARYCISLFLYL